MGTATADDVQVNTYILGEQARPSVSLDADGDFVVVWESERSGGTEFLWSIQGRRYASDGSTIRGEFQINTTTLLEQRRPSVSLDADGDFVVVWESERSGGTDSAFWSIQGQRFASDGSRVGDEIQINTYTSGSQRYPSVSSDSDGDFVVVWHGAGKGPDYQTSVQGQRFASDGARVGGEFQVNTYIAGAQNLAAVSSDADGDFVVVWQSTYADPPDTSFASIQGQRFASDGSFVGDQFQVNTYTTLFQLYPAVSSDADGDFVVVWKTYFGASGPDPATVQGQRFSSDGSFVGGEFQVNTNLVVEFAAASVSLDMDGDFVVVWHSFYGDGSDSLSYSIRGQRFTSDGSFVGGELQINTYTTGPQKHPVVSVDSDGDFVVVWHSYGSGGTDNLEYSIQRAEKTNVPIFVDGFESGDVSVW